ncbi:MAG: GNAT family N-acetyltransferase [Rhizomicrobium sp.]
MSFTVDPLLMESWLQARSVSRGLPQPVADRGGWRVDSALPHEKQRYLFVRPAAGLREIAESIREPLIFLKLCDTSGVMRSWLPRRWEIVSSNFVMICDGGPRRAARQLPAGYRLETKTNSAVTHACVLSATGELAASGYAAEYAGVFIYDRILTTEAHRRKGLGAIVMTALASARQSSSAPQILAATPAGRALYLTLGWSDCAPYTTAAIPDRPASGSAE